MDSKGKQAQVNSGKHRYTWVNITVKSTGVYVTPFMVFIYLCKCNNLDNVFVTPLFVKLNHTINYVS